MIPIPQPSRPTGGGASPATESPVYQGAAGDGGGGGQRLPPRPTGPRRTRLRRALIVAGAIIVVLLIVAAVAVIAFKIDLLLVGLIAAAVVLGAASYAIALLPQGIPGLRLVRTLVGYASILPLAAILYLYVYPLAQTVIPRLSSAPGGTSATTAPGLAEHRVTVTYEVTGTAPSATITMNPSESGSSETATNVTLPFMKTVTISTPANRTLTSLTANTDDVIDGGTVGCSITVDGVVVETKEPTIGSAVCLG